MTRPALLLSLAISLVLVAAPPAPAKRRPIKLNVHAGKVKVGTEKQTCFPVVFPRDEAIDVDRVEIRVRGGSHHVHLYRPVAGTVMYPNADNTYSPAGPGNRKPRECAFAIDFARWELVAASQAPVLVWQLHPGVGIHFEPRQPLMIQTHFVNTGFGNAGLAVRGRTNAKMILRPMEASAVSAYGGALFGQDRTVNVPPGTACSSDADCPVGARCSSASHCSLTDSSVCHMTGNVSDNETLNVMALTGHYHFRGTRYRVWRTLADGTRGELVYLQEGYSDPAFMTYAPGQLRLQPGEGLEWECTWQNDSDQTFPFGPDTGKNEHCNLFGFYYPTHTPLESMDCVHKEDGSEIRTIRR